MFWSASWEPICKDLTQHADTPLEHQRRKINDLRDLQVIARVINRIQNEAAVAAFGNVENHEKQPQPKLVAFKNFALEEDYNAGMG